MTDSPTPVPPAEQLLTLIDEALDLPDPPVGDEQAWRRRDDLLKARVAAVLGSLATVIDCGAVEYLREQINARPVTYPTEEQP
jgi:hypothetical protein